MPGRAKVQCQKLNIIGYFFSLSYMPMHDVMKQDATDDKVIERYKTCEKQISQQEKC